MELFDRLLITVLALLFLSVACLMYLDKKNQNIDTTRILLKIQHIENILDDVLNISQDLYVKDALEKITCVDDFVEDDDSSKSVLLQAMELKDDIINECLCEAKKSLKDISFALKFQ